MSSVDSRSATASSWLPWSRDSQYVHFSRMDYEPAVFRLAVRGSKPELVVSQKDFRSTGAAPGWFALTPANEPLLLLRNTGGGTEIYALSWDAP